MLAAILARLPIDESVQIPFAPAVIKLLAPTLFVVIIKSL